MRIFFTILLACCTFLAQAQPQKLLVLGDSLSAGYGMTQQQGWVHLLQQQQNSWQLINASISGETTAGGLARLPELLKKHQPDAVLIELGGNDGLRGFPIAQLEKNLSAMLKLVKQQQAKPILMQIRIPPNYGPRYNQLFVDLYPALAERHQAVYWPFFMDQVATKPELMLSDGIHPNEKAQPIIRDFVLPLLLKL
ncbi:arylesterase [Rheinheimera sp.]|uniref:arylesterase n=1 Tax=Rheinheimera sp. TaxID=1869214 RepID=UPI002FDE3C1D